MATAALTALALATAQQSVTDEDLRRLVERQAVQLESQARTIEALSARVEVLERDAKAAPVATANAMANDQSQSLALGGTARSATPDTRIGRFPDDAVVRIGSFDRALRIPGTTLSLRLGGFVQGDAALDDGEFVPSDAFTASAATPGRPDSTRTRLGARNSRLNLDVRSDTSLGPFRLFIEGDFAGSGGSEIVSNGSAFRLRHAFGQLGGLYVGQYWSAFVDLDAFPETLDPAAPAAKSTVRQAGIRYVAQLGRGWITAVAIENPELDARLPAGFVADEAAPDLLGYLIHQGEWGHLKLAALGRRLAVENGGSAWGWGANLTGRVAVPWLDPKDNIVFAAVVGEGVGRYVLELSGLGIDGEVRGDGRVDPIAMRGGYLGVQHWWGGTFRSTLTAGFIRLDRRTNAPLVPVELLTQSLNLLWDPVVQMTVGIEILLGTRENADRQAAQLRRLLLTARYGF